MLVLTHKDTLNQTYSEDDRLPFKGTISKNDPDFVDTRRSRTSSGGNSVLTHKDDPTARKKPTSGVKRFDCSPEEETLAVKDTRAAIVSTGTATINSSVSLKNTKHQSKMRTNNGGKKPSLNQDQGNQNEFCGLTGGRLSEDTGEKNQENPEIPSNLFTILQKGRAHTGLAAPVQSSCSSATVLTPRPTITAWEAGWNVTNAIQGIFVLGLPFALVHSGYLGLVLLGLSAWVCNHTGRSLVACLYEECGLVSKVRVRHSYQDIMNACCKGLCPNWSEVGGWIINAAQVIELLMTCTLYLLVSTTLLCDSLSGVALPRSVCSLVSLLFLLPCLLLTDLRPVSTLSLLCSLVHILISFLVMLYCLSCASSWSWSSLSLHVDPEDFLVSVGVIIFSYTSQIFLPPLEGSMEDRGQFETMLGWTHGAACIMKTTFSLLAVLTWGTETQEVITDNLPFDLRPVINLCLLAKALLSYPLPFYSAAEILQTLTVFKKLFLICGGDEVSRPALMVRGALLMTSYLLALLVPRFSLLMGLTGSVTGAAMTLILPCLFHLRLQWGRLTVQDRLVDVCILSLGVLCSVSGLLSYAVLFVCGKIKKYRTMAT
uniref:Vesicular inhibitory amino acid transporter n=1 Tax=Kryptolebias marmoratus TaxID=37003 RepID=A0A3Q3BNA1_KRYMA